MRWLALALALAACGDNEAAQGTFRIVGHTDLGGRGKNAALAVAGNTVYVGSRNDRHGVAIVDVTDPTMPEMVGEIALPLQTNPGQSSPELRAVPALDILVVIDRNCPPEEDCQLSFTSPGMTLFDIVNRQTPVETNFYPVYSPSSIERSPSEFFLFHDPAMPERVLAYLATPPGPPSFEIYSLNDKDGSFELLTWEPHEHGIPRLGTGDDVLSSVGASDDGRVAFFSNEGNGLYLVDASEAANGIQGPELRLTTLPENRVTWPGLGPHSAVQVPGRPFLVATDEDLTGCPWGHVHTIDIRDPLAPSIAGEYALPENDPVRCAQLPETPAYTPHAATATENLALVTWHGGGLQAIDIADPFHPFQLAELRLEDTEMWSTPVIQDGLIYVVDVRNGLYILDYEGRHAEEVHQRAFLEGNSNLGAYLPRHQ